jgi:DNA-binding NarL/FixJ family response regulator
MRILLVDNSTTVRSRLLRRISEVNNACVIGLAGDAAQALKLIRVRRPDLVVLDLPLPEKNGFEIIKRITRGPLPPGIMVLTNFATAYHVRLCERLGVKYFFDKMSEIEAAIEKIGELALIDAGRMGACVPL